MFPYAFVFINLSPSCHQNSCHLNESFHLIYDFAIGLSTMVLIHSYLGAMFLFDEFFPHFVIAIILRETLINPYLLRGFIPMTNKKRPSTSLSSPVFFIALQGGFSLPCYLLICLIPSKLNLTKSFSSCCLPLFLLFFWLSINNFNSARGKSG